MPAPRVVVVDLFCGAGGLSFGFKQAGLRVAAGIDTDPDCEYPFETNVGGAFLQQDVRTVTKEDLSPLWGDADVRILAGCAPCQPFSPYRRGQDTKDEDQWSLLAEFGRLVEEVEPELVTMENVPRAGSAEVFRDFLALLKRLDYCVDHRSCNGLRFGLAQERRRLVLLASRLGAVSVPLGDEELRRTVADEISTMPELAAGEVDPSDPVHKTRALSELNLKRIRKSKPGGTWEDWPEDLRAPCHRRKNGATFRNVYARMEWDNPAPTITTLAYNFGTGRFGHPKQNRALSLREASMLQGFPRSYAFVEVGAAVKFQNLGRLIGNAVPPPLAEAIGTAMVDHVNEHADEFAT
jgi:DNA (cytosine-5)-methyltransferase 1